MLLRRTALTLAALAAACAPSVTPDAAGNPKTVDFAVFNPATGSIPLPNDLALQPSAIASQNPTQQALLGYFVSTGGFPSDQEVPVTIDLVRDSIDSKGAVVKTPPPFDVTSLNAATLVAVQLAPGAPKPAALDAGATQYTQASDHGTLSLHNAVNATTKSRAWAPGRYLVAIRGGANGVKSTDGVALAPDAAMYLLTQDKVLTSASLLPLIPGATVAEKQANAAQLEQVRQSYLPAFAVVDQAFPHKEIASLTVFTVGQPGGTEVVTDPSAGLMPLPSDFLLDASGHPSAQFAANFGPLAPGLQKLDGFSTTAMILSNTSAPVVAPSITNKSVLLYELNLTASPPTATRLLDAAEALPGGKVPAYITEPPAITTTPPGSPVAVSTAIGLQPAHAVTGGYPSTPLKEGTEYVVLVTDRVHDLAGKPLVRSTLNQIVLLDPTLPIAVSGKSQLSGVPDDQAAGLDRIRSAVNLAIGSALADASLTPSGGTSLQRSDIVAAYSFRTQTFKSTAVSLAALPYQSGNATLSQPPATVPANLVFCNPTNAACPATANGNINAVYTKYGIAAAPQNNVGFVLEEFMTTLDGLDPATGAFVDLTKVQPTPAVIPVMIALPTAAAAGCTGAPCTVPLAIFRHGLGGTRSQMLLIADTLTKNGIAVAAIDAAKHGDRAWCNPANNSAATPDCTTTCVADPALAKQGDAAGQQPGHCQGATPVDSKLTRSGTSIKASSNYLVSLNFFRTRDTLRQDLIDESQLIRVLSPNPAGVAPNGLTTASFGFQIDPSRIFYVGQSLGAIQGVVDVAANPRVKRANFNVGGGTVVDVFSTSPTLSPQLNALLATQGIAPGSPAYLQTLQVGKWVLDPAEPVNYAVNLLQSPLASPISGGAAPAGRDFIGQMANGDTVVPNEETVELFKLIPLKDDAAGGTTTFEVATSAAAAGNAVQHGFLLDWTNYPVQANAAQADTASFFLTGTHPSATSLQGP